MSFKDLTYRKKNLMLLVGTFFLLVLGYIFSFGKTIEVWQSNEKLEEDAAVIQNAPTEIQNLKANISYLDRSLRSYVRDTISGEEYLLEKISESCRKYGVILVELLPPQLLEENEYSIETRFVKARGGFNNLLRLVYDLENKYQVGRVSSVKYVVEEDRKSNTKHLYARIYIQNLKQKDLF